MTYRGPPLPPPTVLTALALGDPPDDLTRVIPPKDQPFAATTYTLDLFDDGMFKRSTSDSPVTLVIPKNVDIPIPVNSTIHVMQGGTGNITFAAAPGVTLNAQDGTLVTPSQWSVMHLWQYDIDKWVLYGKGFGGGGGGGGGAPSPPNFSVQYDNSGAFGGSSNWIFDPANSRYTLGIDTVYEREAAHTVGIHAPTVGVPLSVNVYGRYDPTVGAADNFDRMKLGGWALDANQDFYMGVVLESEWNTDGWVLLQPCGHGGITYEVPDGGANGDIRGHYAVDLQFLRGATNAVAAGTSSALIAGTDNEIQPNADYSGIFVGDSNDIDPTATMGIGSAKRSAIAGGRGNYISGNESFIGGGGSNSVIGNDCAAIGGVANRISDVTIINPTPPYSHYSAVIAGQGNLLYGDQAVALGGFLNWIDANQAVAMGAYAHTRGIKNAFVQGAGRARRSSGGSTTPPGQFQSASYVLQGITQVDFPTLKLTIDGLTTLSAANALLIRNGAAYGFEVRVSCKRQGFSEGGYWIITGCIVLDDITGPSSIAFVGTPVVTVVARTNVAWTAGVVANTTLGSLDIVVTGAPDTAVWWMAHVRTSEAWSRD